MHACDRHTLKEQSWTWWRNMQLWYAISLPTSTLIFTHILCICPNNQGQTLWLFLLLLLSSFFWVIYKPCCSRKLHCGVNSGVYYFYICVLVCVFVGLRVLVCVGITLVLISVAPSPFRDKWCYLAASDASITFMNDRVHIDTATPTSPTHASKCNIALMTWPIGWGRRGGFKKVNIRFALL